MTTPYLTTRTVAARLRIGPRRLRTLLAQGRVEGATRMCAPGCAACACGMRYDGHAGTGPWLIPADFTLSPRPHGPLPNWRKP